MYSSRPPSSFKHIDNAIKASCTQIQRNVADALCRPQNNRTIADSHQTRTERATDEINLATKEAATCCRWKPSFQHFCCPICQRHTDSAQIPMTLPWETPAGSSMTHKYFKNNSKHFWFGNWTLWQRLKNKKTGYSKDRGENCFIEHDGDNDRRCNKSRRGKRPRLTDPALTLLHLQWFSKNERK